MRNFIIFFEGKEGTSPLVRLLSNFEAVSIVHQVDNKGWEPFDKHNCGSMPLKNLEQCLDLIYNEKALNFELLNQIYSEKAARPLDNFSKKGVVGLKMRFIAPSIDFPLMRSIWPFTALSERFVNRSFKSMMFDILKKNNVVVFLAVRQDVFRWALSTYHGDGTGKPGHLQFKLAKGEITKDEIGKIYVDCRRLEEIILKCEDSHARKQLLREELEQAGIETQPICYEDFLSDKPAYFRRLLEILELDIADEEIDSILQKGAYFQKVHSDDISEFVINTEAVLEKFGDRFISWC